MTEAGSVPPQPQGESCLSFSVRGEWGHFRRIEGNIVKQTYRLIPRTTVAGLIAAVLGIGRDEYYDLFGEAVSAIAIEPIDRLRTINVPENTLSTADEDIQKHPSRGHARIGLPDPSNLRQQHNYEMLVNPEYRIDCWIADEETYTTLRNHLEDGKSYYTPCLGLSECLATLEYIGEFEISSSGEAGEKSVDSAVVEAVDSVILEPETPVRTERSPGFMTTDKGGRTTTGFVSFAYNPEGGPLQVDSGRTSEVDGRNVMFI